MSIENLQPQALHEKVDSTEKKLNDLQKEVTDLSIISKLRKKKDIEKELNVVKTDLEELKKNTNLSDTDKEKVNKMETTNTELLASIQTELFDLKWDIENQWQDATRRQKNKKNTLIWVSTLGIWLLIMRWRRKRQERKAAENPDAPPKKWWFLWALGTAAIGVGTFFGVKAIVGQERWGKFRNWLWLKDKEEYNEDEEETETINENLTAEEVQKRNEYIEKSIRESTTMPITIDYGTDKDDFEKKWYPKIISFDPEKQSILLGNKDKITLKTDTFTLEGKSVIRSRFEKIEQRDGKFEVTMKTGVVNGYTPVLESKKVIITKDEFIAILSPYYTEQKTEYTVQLNNNGQNIPLRVWASRERQQSNDDMDADIIFEKLTTFKKGQYTKFGNSINNYYKTLYSMNSKYGQQSDLLWAWAEDDEKFEQNVWSIPAMMDEKFDNVGDIIKDTMLKRVKNIGDITTEKMAGFLEKYKDNPTFGKIMGKISGFLTDLFSRGGTIDTTKLEEVFQNDPDMKKKVSIVIWKMSKIKWYLVDQQDMLVDKIKEIHPNFSDAEQKAELKKIYLDLKIVGESSSSDSALKTLEKYGLLNSINEDREFTIKAEKAAAELQAQIEAAPTPSDRDAEKIADRGKIEYDAKTQRIRSRGVSTEIEIVSKNPENSLFGKYMPGLSNLPWSSDNIYKLKNGNIGLDIEFRSISELVWTANFLNWVDYTYKKNILKEYGHRWSNMLLPDMLKFYSPKFEFVDTNVYIEEDENRWVVGTGVNIIKKIPVVWWFFWAAVNVAKEVPVVGDVVKWVMWASVSGTTGIVTQSDLLWSWTRSRWVMSKDQIEKNASSLLYGDRMDTLTAYMNKRIIHYDPFDDFWNKMLRMWGKVAEWINTMVQNAVK